MEPDSLTKSARFRNRTDLGNVLTAEAASSSAEELLGSNANGQGLTALGPSTFDNKTSIFGGHPHQKTMSSFAGSVAWLKCSFHIGTPNKILQELVF